MQIDILLKQRPKEYDIKICNVQSFDVVLRDKVRTGDVYLYKLTDRQGIYGDELNPIILQLSENTIDCLIDVSLLDSSLLYRYDDNILGELDNYPVFVIDHGGGYNYFSLKNQAVDINKIVYANTHDACARLVSSVDTMLTKAFTAERGNITLSTSGDITEITLLKPFSLSANLTDRIAADISKVCEIMMNASGAHWFDGYLYEYDDMTLSDMDLTYPKMSLVSSHGNVYIKLSLSLDEHNISLGGSIGDFTALTSIRNMVRELMHLSIDASFSYNVFCGCTPVASTLSESDISLKINAYVLPVASISTMSDNIVADLQSTNALGVTSEQSIETIISDDIELYYGLGRYDDELLSYWDTYTIYDMADKVVYNPQNDSVDS